MNLTLELLNNPFTGKALPIIHFEYLNFHVIDSTNPSIYANLVNEVDSLFDAAYFGQYLGGIDPRNEPIGPGYINPYCNKLFLFGIRMGAR